MDSFCKQTLMVIQLWFRRSLLYEQQLRTPKRKEYMTLTSTATQIRSY